MKSFNTLEADGPVRENSGLSRRSFFRGAAVAGAAGVAGFYGLFDAGRLFAEKYENEAEGRAHSKHRDTAILLAAEIAEALAVTTYTNIMNTSGWFTRLPDDDQGYLFAARQEEMSRLATPL